MKQRQQKYSICSLSLLHWQTTNDRSQFVLQQLWNQSVCCSPRQSKRIFLILYQKRFAA